MQPRAIGNPSNNLSECGINQLVTTAIYKQVVIFWPSGSNPPTELLLGFFAEEHIPGFAKYTIPF